MSTAYKLSKFSTWRFRKMGIASAADKDDITMMAVAEQLERMPAELRRTFDPTKAEIDDNLMNAATQRFIRERTEHAQGRSHVDAATGIAASNPAPMFDSIRLTEAELDSADKPLRELKNADVRVRVKVRRIVENATAGFDPPPADCRTRPESNIKKDGFGWVPGDIDREMSRLNFPEFGKGCDCERGCAKCKYFEGWLPSPSEGRPVARSDNALTDAEALIARRKLAIANGRSNSSRIPWFLFDFPLVIDGRTIDDSVLTAYRPPGVPDPWARWHAEVAEASAYVPDELA